MPAAHMAARRAHWWIAGLSIAAYFWLTFAFSVNVPIDDDYDNVFSFYSQFDHTHTAADLLQLLISQDNEHRLLFTRIVLLLERLITGGTDLRRLIFIGNLGTLALFFLLLSLFRGTSTFPVSVALFALLLFQPAAYECMLWASASLQNNYAIAFALLSFILVARHWYLCGACIACLSLYTQADGLLAVLGNAAWICWEVRQGRGSRHRAALAMVVSIGAIGLYFRGYVHPPQHPALLESIVHPLSTGIFFLALVGSSIGYLGLGTAIGAGSGLTLGFIYLTYRRYFTAQPIAYAFMLFLFGTTAMVAVGRSGFGAANALTSRYALVSNCLFACLAVGAVSLAGRQKRRLFVGVRIGALVLAFIHASAAYASTLPTITLRRDSLLEGAAAFASLRLTTGLHYPRQVPAGRLIQQMIDQGHYRLPRLPESVPFERYADLVKWVQVLPMLFSPGTYRGDKIIARIDGSVLVSIESGAIRVSSRTNMPDPEIAILVGTPVLPTAVYSREVERDTTAAGSSLPDPDNRSFEVRLLFPPDTDLTALALDMCIGYESISIPLTLFRGNPPACEDRLLASKSN